MSQGPSPPNEEVCVSRSVSLTRHVKGGLPVAQRPPPALPAVIGASAICSAWLHLQWISKPPTQESRNRNSRERGGAPELFPPRAQLHSAPFSIMSRASQTLFTRANTGLPMSYEVLKEEHEVAMLGPAPSSAPPAPTIISIHADTSVPDHVVWSLFNTLFMNFCCLGFVAFAYSVKSRDRKMVGDLTGAQSYASTAKCLNICALLFTVLMTVVFITLMVTGVVMSR